MTEIEVPTEHLTEEIHHQAEHEGGWISGVALSSAILAGLAAVTALLAGHHANEAMIEEIQSSNTWSHYQAKSIKSALLSNKIEIIESAGHEASEADREKRAEYKKEMEEISEKAREKEVVAQAHLHVHEIFARGVTFFQIAIAVSAISALTRRRRYWFVSLGFGAVGVASLLQGYLSHI